MNDCDGRAGGGAGQNLKLEEEAILFTMIRFRSRDPCSIYHRNPDSGDQSDLVPKAVCSRRHSYKVSVAASTQECVLRSGSGSVTRPQVLSSMSYSLEAHIKHNSNKPR